MTLLVTFSTPGASVQDTEVDQVAALLRARTRDAQGNELGYFNEETRPTATQVRGYVDSAAAEVNALLPDPFPATLEPLRDRAVSLRAAMAVELGYDPDRAGATDSAFSALQRLYADTMAAMQSAIELQNLGPRRKVTSIGVSPWTQPAPDILVGNPFGCW